MPILYDAIIAFLCCAGIMVTFIALFMPRERAKTKIAGIIISDDTDDIVKCIASLNLIFKEVVIVTKQDLNVVIEGVKILSPEEFETYVTGTIQN